MAVLGTGLTPNPHLQVKPERDGGSITEIFTGVGDGTLYYGREVRHHRDALTTEDCCSFWFLFYVPESFDGSLD